LSNVGRFRGRLLSLHVQQWDYFSAMSKRSLATCFALLCAFLLLVVGGAGGGPLIVLCSLSGYAAGGIFLHAAECGLIRIAKPTFSWRQCFLDSAVSSWTATGLVGLCGAVAIALLGRLLGVVPIFGENLASACTWVSDISTQREGRVAVMATCGWLLVLGATRVWYEAKLLSRRWREDERTAGWRAARVALLSNALAYPVVLGSIFVMWRYEFEWAWRTR
jgi:hypothetical protein